MSDIKCDCICPEEVNVPITGITVPFCGFGVNVDVSKLTRCDCDLTREEVLAMIERLGIEIAESNREMQEKFTVIENRLDIHPYELCEFYYFWNPALRPGFRLAHGGVLDGAAKLHPDAWVFLQTDAGRALCLTE